MNAIQLLAAQPWVEQLGWTLIHFLWQGALIAAFYAVARRNLKSARFRYLLACAALVAMLAAPVVTFYLTGTPEPAASNPYVGTIPLSSAAASVEHVSSASLPVLAAHAWQDDIMPWLVMAWFTGAIIFWIRLTGGWIVAARMRSMLVRPAPAEWQRKLDEIKTHIRVSWPVKLLVSALVQVPTVVGWLRPVVLIPVGALTGLPSEHIEALLAHELAHIRRHDYLVNVLQSIAEALLFYHPAVWWISKHIRNERENCCDDIAVAVSGDALTYASALAELESYRPAHLNPALAANGGSVADRVGRILGRPRTHSQVRPGPGVVVGAVLVAITAYGLLGQTPPAKLEFDAASVKASGPFVPGNMRIRKTGGPGTDDPGRIVFEKYVLSDLIQEAYDIKFDQLSGPGWLMNPGVDSPRFDITATMPVGTTKEEFRLMLQSLLAERFKLTVHSEKKEIPAYNLSVGKSRPKLTPSAKVAQATDSGSPPTPVRFTMGPDGFPAPPSGARGAWITFNHSGAGERLQAGGLTMEKFADMLSNQLNRPVNDVTGLKGEFDFVLYWQRDGMAVADTDSLPTVFAAVQEQLGLRLESAKGLVDILAVDHLEKSPTEN